VFELRDARLTVLCVAETRVSPLQLNEALQRRQHSHITFRVNSSVWRFELYQCFMPTLL